MKWVCVVILMVVFVGLFVVLFFWSFDRVMELCFVFFWLIFCMLIVGFVMVWVYGCFGKFVEGGNNLIVD